MSTSRDDAYPRPVWRLALSLRCRYVLGSTVLYALMLNGCGNDPRIPGGGARGGAVFPVIRQPTRDPTIACLLVGVNASEPDFWKQHGLPPLNYAVADAQQLSDDFGYLGVPDENLYVLTDEEATRQGIERCLDEMGEFVQPEDIVVVAFAGHGVGACGKESQLVCYDCLYPIQELLEKLGTLDAGRRVLFMDACRSGSAGRPSFVINSDVLRPREGGLAWSSGAMADQRSYESDALKHGIYTHCLSTVLRNSERYDSDRDGWLNFEEIASAVKGRVEDQTGRLGYEQDADYGVVGWQGSTRFLPVRKDWTLEVVEPIHCARVRVQFPPHELRRGDRLWLVVAPRQTSGLYYPQPHAVIDAQDGPHWAGHVYLGRQDGVGIGEQFRVVLVQVDPELHDHFWSHTPGEPMRDPLIVNLRVRAEQTVIRSR